MFPLDLDHPKSYILADRIKEILQERNLTIADFASLMEISYSTANKWFTGTYNFPISLLFKIEDKLNITIIQLE